LKVTFLGTGTSQGVPVIACTCEVCTSLDFRNKRLRTSIHIDVNGKSLVIDTGPDFRQQMLRENIERLDAVLFTHAHRDHTSGLDDVRAFNFKQQMDMPVYAVREVIDQIKVEFAYIFVHNNYPGLPRVDVREITSMPFNIDGIAITPLPVMHMRLPVLGFRIGNFSYITDANYISDETIDLLKGTEVLVLNALQREKHISHFNLDEAIATVDRIKPKATYFTHISHKLGLHGEVEKELPKGIALAYDGQQIDVA
jgi:phosphoribosyl 1,2-cyclic phosphate phosphodiesterase